MQVRADCFKYRSETSVSIVLNLFLTFAKIGLFTFGGGYAMISVIEDICVEKKNWITHDEMMDVTVVAESTPGPIAINLATYVGYKLAKMKGAVFATLGMVLPSFVIIYFISRFLDNFLEIELVAKAFGGIKIAVGLLIIDAAVKMIIKMKKKVFGTAMMILSLTAMLLINIFSWNFSSISMLIVAAAIGIVFQFISEKKPKDGDITDGETGSGEMKEGEEQ